MPRSWSTLVPFVLLALAGACSDSSSSDGGGSSSGAPTSTPSTAVGLTGKWLAAEKVPGLTSSVILDAQQAAGQASFTGELILADQLTEHAKLLNGVTSGASVSFDLPEQSFTQGRATITLAASHYTGTLAADGNTITGSLTVLDKNAATPLTFHRAPRPPEVDVTWMGQAGAPAGCESFAKSSSNTVSRVALGADGLLLTGSFLDACTPSSATSLASLFVQASDGQVRRERKISAALEDAGKVLVASPPHLVSGPDGSVAGVVELPGSTTGQVSVSGWSGAPAQVAPGAPGTKTLYVFVVDASGAPRFVRAVGADLGTELELTYAPALGKLVLVTATSLATIAPDGSASDVVAVTKGVKIGRGAVGQDGTTWISGFAGTAGDLLGSPTTQGGFLARLDATGKVAATVSVPEAAGMLGVGDQGSVVFAGLGDVARYDASGALVWSKPLTSKEYYAVQSVTERDGSIFLFELGNGITALTTIDGQQYDAYAAFVTLDPATGAVRKTYRLPTGSGAVQAQLGDATTVFFASETKTPVSYVQGGQVKTITPVGERDVYFGRATLAP